MVWNAFLENEEVQKLSNSDYYVISKRDENGFIHVNNKKYNQRLAGLKEELKHTKGFFNRLMVRLRIFDWRMAKISAKINNGITKTSRGAAKVSNSIGQVSKQPDQFADVSGFHEELQPRKSKRGKRKHRAKKQNDYDIFKGRNDYGFNMKDVFDL